MSAFRKMVDALKEPVEAVKQPVEAVGEKVSKPFHALEKEKKLGPVLHAEVLAALKQLQEKHPEIKKDRAVSRGTPASLTFNSLATALTP